MHRLTWHKTGQNEELLREYFMLALIDSGASVTLQDGRQDYLFIANLPDCWKADADKAPTDGSLYGEDIAARLAAVKTVITRGGDKGVIEATVATDRIFEFRVQGTLTRDGTLHLVTTIVDLSEERRRELLLRALLREVSHRSKNLLAIIQSIASQTARHSGTLDGFLQKFRGRLHSLSQSQDLVTDSAWRGSHVFDLARYQTDRFVTGSSHLVVVEGDNVRLTPSASLHVGLALHELIVNAVSHGSFLLEQRPIVITSTRTKRNGRDFIEIEWNEKRRALAGGEPVDPNRQFGSAILERVVPASVNGEARYGISEHEIRYHLAFPAEVEAA